MKILKHHGTILVLACVLLTCSGALLRAENDARVATAITETTIVKSGDMDIVNDSLHVSDDANHLAFVVRLGDRQAMVLDGIVGKAYDGEISGDYFSLDDKHVVCYLKHNKKERVVVDDVASDEYDNIAFCFSPNSKHWAYIGLQGVEDILVTDTGEVNHWNVRRDKYGSLDLDWVEYSPDSQRMGYLVNQGNCVKINIDGIDGPSYDKCIWLPTFSPNSKRVTYSAWRGAHAYVVVDGDESAAYDELGGNPIFSPDSQHLVYGARRGEQWYLVVNGTETAVEDQPVPYYSPDSKHLIYRVVGPDNGEIEHMRTYLDGKRLTGSEDIEWVSFSDNGARMGYVAKNGNNSTVIIDGLAAGTYAGACEPPRFSPDGKRVACQVMPEVLKNSREVVDGVEGALYDDTQNFHFSPDSRHYVYEAKRGDKWLLVLDNVEVYTADAFLSAPLFDSPDTLHLLAVQGGGNEAVRATVHIASNDK